MAEQDKGRAFTGAAGGGYYRFWARIFGMGPGFYRKGIGGLHLDAGMKALDLGCGPGALSFALAETADATAHITGIDLSDDQLAFARKHAGKFACSLEFQHASMDELPFDDACLDLVMASMAIHETPPPVRRAAIAEAARVLKPGGAFLLVEWAKPRLGLWGLIWYPFLLSHVNKQNDRDNWDNAYPALCKAQGLALEDERYINSIARRQLFRLA